MREVVIEGIMLLNGALDSVCACVRAGLIPKASGRGLGPCFLNSLYTITGTDLTYCIVPYSNYRIYLLSEQKNNHNSSHCMVN